MSVRAAEPTATVHPRHTDKRTAKEHARIAARFRPSARELFPVLNPRRKESAR